MTARAAAGRSLTFRPTRRNLKRRHPRVHVLDVRQAVFCLEMGRIAVFARGSNVDGQKYAAKRLRPHQAQANPRRRSADSVRLVGRRFRKVSAAVGPRSEARLKRSSQLRRRPPEERQPKGQNVRRRRRLQRNQHRRQARTLPAYRNVPTAARLLIQARRRECLDAISELSFNVVSKFVCCGVSFSRQLRQQRVEQDLECCVSL